MFPLYTYVKNVFPATCQTVQHWKQKVDITCGLLLVVPFKNVSLHTLKPIRVTSWPVISSVFFDVWHDDTRRKHLKFDQESKMILQNFNVLAARCEFKMRADRVFKVFYRHLGFSHVVCSLSSLTLMAEIHVTNMWMTPLIKTMQDDYSYFCISVMLSLQVHPQMCTHSQTHTRHTWSVST